MNREDLKPAGLEGFELWDRLTHAPARHQIAVAFVSIRIGGTISMNKAAYALWGEPDACQVMYDPERRRIALAPCKEDEPNSYPVSWRKVQITVAQMFKFYGVEITQTRRYHDPKVIDGVMIVDL